eukprot:CAMPEP_0177680308 /NCGR_PEP_ID=MMETSP0447-20121125/30102_1 /TAXON_ID=0 /ORGANISM="Stygamoeba regulata, Strain BSH-02190019" /LENGTH=151 /DNA_ID=CAMNT_0019189627 /DNA_START=553 /DNA_END=1006 /DNA_ORIENTATION=-
MRPSCWVKQDDRKLWSSSTKAGFSWKVVAAAHMSCWSQESFARPGDLKAQSAQGHNLESPAEEARRSGRGETSSGDEMWRNLREPGELFRFFQGDPEFFSPMVGAPLVLMGQKGRNNHPSSHPSSMRTAVGRGECRSERGPGPAAARGKHV